MRSGNFGNRVLHRRRSSHASIHRIRLDARLKNVHPPVFWKSLDHQSRRSKTRLAEKQGRDASTRDEQLRADGCHYTTLTYRRTHAESSTNQAFRVYMDFQHDGLQHATWKEAVDDEQVTVDETRPSSVQPAMVEAINPRKQRVYARATQRVRSEQDDLFALDTAPYPNRSMPMSRRPRDALHIDFRQAARFQESKVETTGKAFFHRKYLVRVHSAGSRAHRSFPSLIFPSYHSTCVNRQSTPYDAILRTLACTSMPLDTSFCIRCDTHFVAHDRIDV